LALKGKKEEHHRFLLNVQLRRLRAVEQDLGILEHRIQAKLKPYAADLTLLDEIPGADETLAAAILADMGVDMSVFGTAGLLGRHLSWQ
jgi:transposase